MVVEWPLNRFPFLTELSESASDEVRQALAIHDVAAKTPLVECGDRVGGAYLVDAGALRVYNISPDGREATLYWIEPGESCILAMNCAFNNLQYPAWVESSEEPTRFGVLPAPLFRRLFTAESSVQRFAFNVLAGRVLELTTLLEEAGSFGVEQRLAALLVRKCDEAGVVAMSQEVLATHLGTAREVVSRTLRRLAARELVKTSRGAVTVLDPTGLAELPR